MNYVTLPRIKKLCIFTLGPYSRRMLAFRILRRNADKSLYSRTKFQTPDGGLFDSSTLIKAKPKIPLYKIRQLVRQRVSAKRNCDAYTLRINRTIEDLSGRKAFKLSYSREVFNLKKMCGE